MAQNLENVDFCKKSYPISCFIHLIATTLDDNYYFTGAFKAMKNLMIFLNHQMQMDVEIKDDQCGEPLFIVKPFQNEKKERKLHLARLLGVSFQASP